MSNLDMADELKHVAAYIGAVYIPNCEIAQREAVKTILVAADDIARLRARVAERDAALERIAESGCDWLNASERPGQYRTCIDSDPDEVEANWCNACIAATIPPRVEVPVVVEGEIDG